MNDEQTSKPLVAPASDAKTNALLAWIFAPITSFLWLKDQDEFLRHHARESFYFGILNIALYVIVFIVQTCVNIVFLNLLFGNVYSLSGLGALFSCFWGMVWLALAVFSIVPRVIGLVKANNGELWTVPLVSEYMSKIIKV